MKKLLSICTILLFMLAPAQIKKKDYDKIMASKNIYEIDAFLRDAHINDPRRKILKPRLMDLIATYIKEAYPDDQNVPKLQEKLVLLKKNPSTKISFEEMTDVIKKKQRLIYENRLKELNNPSRNIAKNEPKNSGENSANSANSAYYTDAIARAKGPNMASGKSTEGAVAYTAKASSMMGKGEDAEFDLLMNESPIEHKNKTVQLLNKLFDNDPSSKDCIVMIENKSDCNMIVRIDGVGNTKYRLAIPAKNENSIVVKKGDYLFTSVVCGAQYASQKTVQKAMMVSLSNPKL